ncbi:MAG: hypothetical protein HC837_15810 [Chloroflexaceae bacterium]|nr:hypothetical protein [Chloroflexaceae bacterium]
MTNVYHYRRRSYLERYEQGHYEEVWLELTALGPTVRQEPIYSEAVAVARETMRRVRHNLELLVERLPTLNYRFATTPPLEYAHEQKSTYLQRIEQQYNPLPLSIRQFYEVFDEVTLLGDHPVLNRYDMDDTLDQEELSDELSVLFTDPLCLFSLAPLEGTVEGIDDESMRQLGQFATIDLTPDLTFFTSAQTQMNKLIIPNSSMDVHATTGTWAGMLFISYLRLSFKWGGFAGFSYQPEAAKVAKAELDFLTKDLLPI